MKFELFYKEAYITAFDGFDPRTITYTTTRRDGGHQYFQYHINRGFVVQILRGIALPAFNWVFGNRVETNTFKRVAFSQLSDPPKFKPLEDKNLQLVEVREIKRRDFYALLGTPDNSIVLYCSDARMEPIHENFMELMTGQSLLVECLNEEPINGNAHLAAYRIVPLYNQPFPIEQYPPRNHIGFFYSTIGTPNEPFEEAPVWSFSIGNNYNVLIISEQDVALWMMHGVFCFYQSLEVDQDAGTSVGCSFSCLGKIYPVDSTSSDGQVKFKNVPCVFRKFLGLDCQTMWNDFLGLVECHRSELLKLENLGFELRDMDIVYLDVTFDGAMKGSNMRIVDRFVEHSLREHCSNSLQTADFFSKRVGPSDLKTLDGIQVTFSSLDDEMLKQTPYLRITYYYYADVGAYEPFLVAPIENVGEVWGGLHLLPMKGIARNPNVRYDVDKTTEEDEKSDTFGYISKYSHNPREPFEVTFMNGETDQFPNRKREDWMNYGVFVKFVKEKKEAKLRNRGCLCPITSNRGYKSIVVPAIACVEVHKRHRIVYGYDTIFGKLRIIENDEDYHLIQIEHGSKILLKNIRFTREEWSAEYDSFY